VLQVVRIFISYSIQIELTGKLSNIVKPLNTKLNPICHLLALLGAHHILHVSRVRVKTLVDAVSNCIFIT